VRLGLASLPTAQRTAASCPAGRIVGLVDTDVNRQSGTDSRRSGMPAPRGYTMLCRRQVPSNVPTGVLGLVIENIRASIVIWGSDLGIARPAGPNLQSEMPWGRVKWAGGIRWPSPVLKRTSLIALVTPSRFPRRTATGRGATGYEAVLSCGLARARPQDGRCRRLERRPCLDHQSRPTGRYRFPPSSGPVLGSVRDDLSN